MHVSASVCTACFYEGCEPSSLSIAALMSPPVAMRACRLASRLMKPMALSWSSWVWNRTSGVWVYRGQNQCNLKKKHIIQMWVYWCKFCIMCVPLHFLLHLLQQTSGAFVASAAAGQYLSLRCWVGMPGSLWVQPLLWVCQEFHLTLN